MSVAVVASVVVGRRRRVGRCGSPSSCRSLSVAVVASIIVIVVVTVCLFHPHVFDVVIVMSVSQGYVSLVVVAFVSSVQQK